MKNVALLIETILDTYDDATLLPKSDGTTFCNVAVSRIAHAMGCNQLDGKTADDIMGFISTSPDWKPLIPNFEIQDLANEGSLIVAGLTAAKLNQSHGHVVIVRPGIMTDSGKWGLVPRVLNIGASNFIARGKKGPLTNALVGINESFVPAPLYYAWRPSL